jgi:hypothetical protein
VIVLVAVATAALAAPAPAAVAAPAAPEQVRPRGTATGTLAGRLLPTPPGHVSATTGATDPALVLGWSGPAYRRHDAVSWGVAGSGRSPAVGPSPPGFDARSAMRVDLHANAHYAGVAARGGSGGPRAGFMWSFRSGTYGGVEGDDVRPLAISLLGATGLFERRIGTTTDAVLVDEAGGRREVTGMVVTSGLPSGDDGLVAAGYRYAGEAGTEQRVEPVTSDGTTMRSWSVPEGRSGAITATGDQPCGETFDLVTETVSGIAVQRRTDRRPAVWRGDGLRFDLPVLGVESWCTAGSSGQSNRTSGTSAGQFRRADGTIGAVMWRRGKAYEIGPEGAEATVVAVHPRGLAVGTVEAAGGVPGYSFVAGPGTWRKLRVGGSTAVTVTGVNAAGVSGTLAGRDGRSRAAAWTLPREPLSRR